MSGAAASSSWRVGQRFSANGDFLSFAVDGKEEIEPNYGPVITRITDYNLFHGFNRDHAFILQDAAFPAFASWSVMGAMPRLWSLGNVLGAIKDLFHRVWGGGGLGRVGFFMGSLLRNDAANRTAVLLCMGLDKGTGTMKLDRQGYLVLDWPFRDNRKLYDAVLAMGGRFKRAIGGVLLLGLHLALGGGLGLALAWIPVLFCAQLLLTAGAALLLSCTNVLFRDIGYMAAVAVLFGFYATPVFYPLDLVLNSQKLPAVAKGLYLLNPMAELLTAYRQALFELRTPDLWLFAWPCVSGAVLFLVGAWTFRRLGPSLSDYL